MDSVEGIDVSNWQGEISQSTANCLAGNVKIAVVRLSLEDMPRVNLAKQQIGALKAAGLQVHGYIWMYPSWDPIKTLSDVKREYGQYHLPWWWIDAEEVKDIADPARNTYWLHTALWLAGEYDVRAGIYTGKWWWDDPRFMAGSTEFKEVPLWYAEYDSDPDLFHWTPFGGWLNPGGKQYSAADGMCGINPIDHDTFAAWVYAPTPGPEPEPTLDQVKLGLIRKCLDGDWSALKRDATKLAG